jgi:S-(hydroxymethyl)glutathione dehydrogenase/alcohol dehydrogenase
MPRAVLVTEPNAPLEVVDLALDEPAADQVRVRLAAAGVCHSDLSARAGTMAWPRPMVLGHEGAGVVTAVGEDVAKVAVGDHVILAWNQPCRACYWCGRGEPWLCGNATEDVLSNPYGTVDGERVQPFLGAGAFAEETLLLDRAVVPIADDVPLETAALIGCAVTTGVGAVLRTAEVAEGDTVAIIGCGGVGLSVVQGARVAGASRVIAVDLKREKLELAERFGATDLIDASGDVDVVKAIRSATGGIGADHVFEVLGLSLTIRQAFSATRRGGTTVVVGVGSAKDKVEFSAMELFWMARTLVGCVYGNADPDVDFARMLELVGDGRLELDQLVTDRVDLADVEAALDAMAEGRGIRTVVTF